VPHGRVVPQSQEVVAVAAVSQRRCVIQIIPQDIPEVLLLELLVYGDSRVFFVETARLSVLLEAGIPELVQHNQLHSRQGVLMGLHYQLEQTQGKFVRCARNRVFDLAVDVRRSSPTFGRAVGAELNDQLYHQ